MIAVLYDIHANLEALKAVFADLKNRNVQTIYFLGDIVGYGPDPVPVLDFMKHFEFCLMGNHDRATLTGPPKNFNPIARAATAWTRKQLNPNEMRLKFLKKAEFEKKARLWRFLMAMKPYRKAGELMFCHDNPSHPGDDKYVRKVEDAEAAFKINPETSHFFIGHSHVPRIYRPGEMIRPEFGRKYPYGDKVIINVGSVGQPRDRDPRACYVVIDDEGFRFIRVAYDFETTMAKIRKSPLNDHLADRLAKGT